MIEVPGPGELHEGPRPELTVVIPAYQAAPFVVASVRELLAYFDARGVHAEVVVVDDGSTDGTADLLARMAATEARLRLIRLGENRGKGAAVRAGVRFARAPVVAYTDADLPYAPAELLAVARRSRDVDLAVGARDLSPEGKLAYAIRRRLASAVFGIVVDRTFSLGVRDTQCGLKAFRTPIARALFDASEVDGFAFDVELLVLARWWGLRLDQVPVTMRPSRSTSVRLVSHAIGMSRDLAHVHRRMRRGLPTRPRHTRGEAG